LTKVSLFFIFEQAPILTYELTINRQTESLLLNIFWQSLCFFWLHTRYWGQKKVTLFI